MEKEREKDRSKKRALKINKEKRFAQMLKERNNDKSNKEKKSID